MVCSVSCRAQDSGRGAMVVARNVHGGSEAEDAGARAGDRVTGSGSHLIPALLICPSSFLIRLSRFPIASVTLED